MIVEMIGKLILLLISLLIPVRTGGGYGEFSPAAVWLSMSMFVLLLSAVACSLLFSLLGQLRPVWLLCACTVLLAAVTVQPDLAHFLPLLLYDCFALLFQKNSRPVRTACILILLAAVLILLLQAGYIQLILLAVSACIALFSVSITRLRQTALLRLDEQREQILLLHKKSSQAHAGLEREQHLAALQERNRISRQLHDVIGHTLSASILQLEAFILTEQDPQRQESLRTLQSRLSDGMNEIRAALHGLHQESFDLKVKIEQLIADHPLRNFRLRCELPQDLPFELRFDMLNIVKEGMTNFMKHSDGDRMSISLISQPAFYTIRLEDNGSRPSGRTAPETARPNAFGGSGISLPAGSNSGSPERQGMGLLAMREIAEKYGGSFNLLQSKGFGILITLPRNQTAAQE